MSDHVWSAEVRDKRAWAEMTFPGARLGRKKQPNAESRKELHKLKQIFPPKMLKHNVEIYDLMDYRVRAKKLPPKGDYYGMKNFHRLLSVANYYRLYWKYGYPEKNRPLSLYELVENLDIGLDEDVMDGSAPLSSRSEPGVRRQSDSDLQRYRLRTTDDIKTKSSSVHKHTRAHSVKSRRSK